MKTDSTLYINFNLPVLDASAHALMASFCLLLSSPGGSVFSGITIYNYLRAYPKEIITCNFGSVDSIATVIFLAGDKRIACPNSSFLFHGVKSQFSGVRTLDVFELKEITSSLTTDQNKISGVIQERTSLKADEIEELFKQGESKDVNFALEKGIIEKIEQLVLPKGAMLINIDIAGLNPNR